MSQDSKCPRCGLKELVTESHYKYKIDGNVRVHAIGDYIRDKCKFCGWHSNWTWTKGGWKKDTSPPITTAARLKLNKKIRAHLKIKEKTTTRKRAREH